MDSNYKNATHNIKSKSWPQKYNDKQPSQCLWSISMDPAMRQQGIKMVFELGADRILKALLAGLKDLRIRFFSSASSSLGLEKIIVLA